MGSESLMDPSTDGRVIIVSVRFGGVLPYCLSASRCLRGLICMTRIWRFICPIVLCEMGSSFCQAVSYSWYQLVLAVSFCSFFFFLRILNGPNWVRLVTGGIGEYARFLV